MIIAHRVRVRVFVDFWNFELSVKASVKKKWPGFKIDWRTLGPYLAGEGLRVIDKTAQVDYRQVDYQGMNVYGSYSSSDGDRGLRRWATHTLNKFTNVSVTMVLRRRKHEGPPCPVCYQVVAQCPKCDADMRGTEEKGVDTKIATDMIRLAWLDDYDVAVLVSSDRDFVPVVEFLNTKGIKVIHGAFPPQAAELTQKCWGSIHIPSICAGFRR